MARDALRLADELAAHYRYIEQTRSKIEVLSTQRLLVRRDAELVYSGLFLQAITSFERFVEGHFLGLLTGSVRQKGIVARVTVNSADVARAMVLSERRYVDWLPFDLTKKRAEAFFRGGRPFDRLARPHNKLLSDIMCIRNALAHKSHHALRRFENELTAGTFLTNHERSPAGFLRSVFRSNPNQTRYEHYVEELADLARILTR